MRMSSFCNVQRSFYKRYYINVCFDTTNTCPECFHNNKTTISKLELKKQRPPYIKHALKSCMAIERQQDLFVPIKNPSDNLSKRKKLQIQRTKVLLHQYHNVGSLTSLLNNNNTNSTLFILIESITSGEVFLSVPVSKMK